MNLQKIRKNKIIRSVIIFTITIISIIIYSSFLPNFNSYATGGSSGSSGSGAGVNGPAGAGNSIVWKGDSSTYLSWKYWYNNGSYDLNFDLDNGYKTKIGKFNAERKITVPKSKVSAYIVTNLDKASKYSNWSGEHWWRWAWYGGMLEAKGVKETWESSSYLTDSNLLAQASKDGYYRSGNRYYNGSKYLDVIWSTGWSETSVNKKWTLINVYDSRGHVFLEDQNYRTAEDLYNNPIKSVKYYDETKEDDINYNNKITAVWMLVSCTSKYQTDGSNKWDYSYEYSKITPTSTYTMDINYNVKTKDINQQWFIPYDLNKNNIASNEDILNVYPNFNNNNDNNKTIKMDIDIDNYQNINDGSYIKTLDTNTSTKFKVKFNNNQFGIPKKNKGGFDIKRENSGNGYKMENGINYNNNIFDNLNYNMDTSGIFKWKNNNNLSNAGEKIINGKLSSVERWNPSISLTLDKEKQCSLTYQNEEKVAKDSLNFIYDSKFSSGDFIFKTIKTDIFKLQSNNRNFWEVKYEQGQFYSYGVKYEGYVDLNDIQEPTVVSTNKYVKLNSKVFYQPIVKGTFKSKTVAGNIG